MSEERSGFGRHGLELNPELDRALFAETFARQRLVQIPSLLTVASAERLRRALAQETPWTLTHNMDGSRKEMANLAPVDRMRLAIESRGRARRDFAYFYDSHALSREGEPYAPPNQTFAELVALVNAPEFLGLVRAVTGRNEIALADAEATLFQPGDYRTREDGTLERKNRLAAYEIAMTPAWRVDWGGMLTFIGSSGHIEKGFVPTFNTLTLFAVPRTHFVSHVALHGGLRYAVSGGLRTGER